MNQADDFSRYLGLSLYAISTAFVVPMLSSLVSQYGGDHQKVSSQSMLSVREVFKKSKWKFKMAFAMKGGGGVETGLECHIPILKKDFFKNHLESFPDCENVFCT